MIDEVKNLRERKEAGEVLTPEEESKLAEVDKAESDESAK